MSDPVLQAAIPVEAGPAEPYAHWWRRAVAVLVDTLLQLPFVVVSLIGSAVASRTGASVTDQLAGLVISLVASVGSLWFGIWNQYVRQGRRGATLGKMCVGILLLSQETARPIGGWACFARAWIHIIDVVPLGLGYLWPLWDKKRQTFTDKVMNTAVLYLPDVQF